MAEDGINWAYVAVLSYGIGALAFAVLLALLLSGWRGTRPGRWLVAAVAITLTAALLGALAAATGMAWTWPAQAACESAATAGWLLYLSRLVAAEDHLEESPSRIGRFGPPTVLVLAAAAILSIPTLWSGVLPAGLALQLRFVAAALLAIFGLVMVEQIYRNSNQQQRWAYKFLCLGAGAIFAYDLFLYSDAILFRRIDPQFWVARGLILAMVAPLLAIAAVRTQTLSIKVFVSRAAVLHGAALLGAGLYLLAVASVGYLIRSGLGDWGRIAQAAFLGGALILLLVLLFSGQVRARARVLISKHFFRYRYDYRDEWLRLIGTLSDSAEPDMRVRAIAALAQLLDSRWGQLWTLESGTHYAWVAAWNRGQPVVTRLAADDPLIAFLRERKWVIDLEELQQRRDLYGGLSTPAWVAELEDAWVVTPLFHLGSLLGVTVLGPSTSRRSLNWEDHDLLKTAGQQISSYLALMEANEQLVRARQFEAFNRLSAYVVHDLKNVSAQLSLISANAKRYGSDPEFVADAFATVAAAAAKVDHMVADLRKGMRQEGTRHTTVALAPLLARVARRRAGGTPRPLVAEVEQDLQVQVVPHRFERILEHLVQNAQEATADDGQVRLSAHGTGAEACIVIADSGCGMDPEFIRTRLFQPFDTTKGNAGMGIGAYESRQTVEELGGRLEVTSALGQGTTFSLYLPLVGTTEGGDTKQDRREAEGWE